MYLQIQTLTKKIAYSAAIGLCTAACVPQLALAQSTSLDTGLRNSENAILIVISPTVVAAGSHIHASAESPILDLAHSDVTWTVDGKVVSHGVGITSADFTIDSAADPVTVNVDATDLTWGEALKTLVVTPLQVDLLYDAPTYVPPFYRGRALASPGTSVRLQALARLPLGNGLLSDSLITYTWSRNGRVLGDVSGLGKSSITIDAPALYSADTISVKASSQDDTLSASAAVTIPGTNPMIALYEDHPLFGIMYHQAIPLTSTSQESEETFAAIPYFADATNANDANLHYEWRVNDSLVAASTTKSNELTVRAGSGGLAAITLALSHAVNFFLTASGKWNVTFGSGGTHTTSAPGGDAFHAAQ